MRRLRVLTFTSLFPNARQPQHGLFVRERVRALARLCDLEVVAPVPWSPSLPGLPDRYRTYRAVPSTEEQYELAVAHPRFVVIPKVLKRTDGLLMGLSCAAAIEAIKRRFPFDVIDAHWAYPDGVAAMLAAQRVRTPFSITVRGDDVNVFAKERGRGPWIRRALSSASLVIAVSTALKDAVLELTNGAARIAVIPNGIEPTRFSPVDRSVARRRLNLPPGDRLILSVGRLHESKGHAVLTEAVGRIVHRFANVRLVLIGDPDSEADARPAILAAAERAGLGDRLLMPGAQDPRVMRLWYSAADLFALPTSREGSPNVIREALACGLPCVTTPVGGIPEVLTDARLGRLVPPTADDFAAALADALARPWDRAAIARAGADRTWDVVAAECLQHLSEIARS